MCDKVYDTSKGLVKHSKLKHCGIFKKRTAKREETPPVGQSIANVTAQPALKIQLETQERVVADLAACLLAASAALAYFH